MLCWCQRPEVRLVGEDRKATTGQITSRVCVKPPQTGTQHRVASPLSQELKHTTWGSASRHWRTSWASALSSRREEKTTSPQPLLLLLSQLHVTLNHLQDVLRLVVRQARQVQLAAHRFRLFHSELPMMTMAVNARRRRAAGAVVLEAEVGTRLEKDKEI